MACSNRSFNAFLLIEKSENPRALKNVTWVVTGYKSFKNKAWMCSVIYKDWFFECFVPGVTKYLKDCGLPIKAVLLTENPPTHPAADLLVSGNITVNVLASNATALLQPMDQGLSLIHI